MGFKCRCQLPKEHDQYVYGLRIFDDETYVEIAPKDDFHYDGHLSSVLNLPKELGEASEGSFEYDTKLYISRNL
jgi:hypothetical protein